MALALLSAAVSPLLADMNSAMRAYEAGDYETAFAELDIMARRGHTDAQKSIAVMYKLGRGVPRNLELAYVWFSIAGKNGYAYAKEDLKLVAKLMTSEQLQSAQRRARNWRTETASAEPPPKPAEKSSPTTSAAQSQGKGLASTTAPQLPAFPTNRTNQTNPNAVAVIIGNKAYGGKIPEVSFAHNDAEAMKRFVINSLGYREGNVIDLRDATGTQLEAVFGNDKTHEGKLFDWIRPGDSDVVVFYSGHGVPGLKDKRAYLLPIDGDANRAEITGYSMATLYRNLGMLPAKSVRVFIDACFSGETPKGMVIRAASGISVVPKSPKGGSGLVTLTAAQGDQLASWDEDAQMGLFTKHLLEALYGAADGGRYGDGDGQVSLAEVGKYLDREMSYQARRRFGRTQKASISGEAATILAPELAKRR